MNAALCIGELLIDFIGSKNACHLSHQSSFMMKAGGAPANVSCVIGALGGECYFYGAVGRDGFGDFLENTLKEFNVVTTNLKRTEKATTLAFVSIDEKGERDFVFVRGADAELEIEDLETVDYEKSQIVHFGAATGFLKGPLKQTYSELCNKAIQDKKCVSFDPNYRSAFWQTNQKDFIAATEAFLNKAHLIKLSDVEAFLLSGTNDLSTAIEFFKSKYDGTFAITLGADGVSLFCKEWDIRVPAPKVKAVDTTGAGDAFIGALIHALACNDDPFIALKSVELMKQYAETANKIAANICTEYGALTALEKYVTR